MKSPSAATLNQRSARASAVRSRAIETSSAANESRALAARASRRASSNVNGFSVARTAFGARLSARMRTIELEAGRCFRALPEGSLERERTHSCKVFDISRPFSRIRLQSRAKHWLSTNPPGPEPVSIGRILLSSFGGPFDILPGSCSGDHIAAQQAQELIDERIRDVGGWRGEALARHAGADLRS